MLVVVADILAEMGSDWQQKSSSESGSKMVRLELGERMIESLAGTWLPLFPFVLIVRPAAMASETAL